MDLTPTIGTDTQTPPPIQPTKPKSLSFTNGTLKPHSTTTAAATPPPSSMVVSYKECLKNHAASIGGHALDGCGEFMPSSSTNPTDPRSLKCAACGCHRNFHRRDSQEQPPNTPTFLTCFYSTTPSSVTPTAPRPQPPPPPPQLPHRAMTPSTSPSLTSSPSHSPSPMSSTPSSPPPLSHLPPPSYSAPHMLLALGNNNNNNNAYSIDHQNRNFHSSSLVHKTETINLSSGKKRHRTKFNQEQKEKMYSFSEKLGWRMQKGDYGSVQEFCNEIGVPRGVFKVWMHNNKNTLRKKSENANPQIGNNNGGSEDVNGNGNGNGDGINNSFNINSSINNDIHKNEDNCVDVHVSFNAMSS